MGSKAGPLCLCWGDFFFFFLFQVKGFMSVLWFCQKDGGEIPAQEMLNDQQRFPALALGCAPIPKPSLLVAELKLLGRSS